MARGTVDVEGGLLAVPAPRRGSIVEVSGVLGQQVARGAILAQLNDGADRAEVDVARAELQRARAESAAVQSRRSLLLDQLARVREAVRLGAESGRVLDDLQLQLEAQTAQLPVARATVSTAEARLREALQSADKSVVHAPAAGRIVQVNARPGALVSTTDAAPLFLIRPRGPLLVRASVASRDIQRIRPGAVVSVTPVDQEGSAYQGRVRSIGEIARKPDATLAADDFSSDRVVDCIIDLGAAPLRIGSLVIVRFGS